MLKSDFIKAYDFQSYKRRNLRLFKINSGTNYVFSYRLAKKQQSLCHLREIR